MSKLTILCEIIGVDPFGADVIEELQDSVNPGICMNDGCDYTTDSIEPDAQKGYCPECKTNTVCSLSVLMGVI